ncbi:MAG: hypothetical protein Q9186_002073 [Xanthomendoza sp. 1 TL-2023]
MQSQRLDDSNLPNDATAPKPSAVWFTRSSSSIQLRNRIIRATGLVRSLPIPSPLKMGKPPPTSPGLRPTAAITPPPPYLELPTTPTSASIAPGEDTFDTKYAQQGLSLLQTSLHERSENPNFARQLYIHAVVYILQGLPTLSKSDIATLRSALPTSLFAPTASKHNDDNESDKDKDKENQTDEKTTQDTHQAPPSLLHRALSTIVFLVIIFIQSLLPYLHHLLSTLQFYNHEYHIQERTCNFGFFVGRRVWEILISTVDPQNLIRLAAEVATAVGDGWRRGLGKQN